MAAVQSMTIPQFLNGCYREESQLINKVTAHLKRNKIKYRIIGTTVFIFVTGVITSGFVIDPIHVFASSSDAVTAMASPTNIDISGRRMYSKLLGLAKWIIIVRGAWESVMSAVRGDNENAKKSFLSYSMVYLILLAFPWVMDEIDGLFGDATATETVTTSNSDRV